VKPLLIIHGWSDEASSFVDLAKAIEGASSRDVTSLFLGNYVSLDDDVQMIDLVKALARAWAKEGLPTDTKSIDVIIHSTGGLIVRDWMYSEFTCKGLRPPINNLIMLAPANFGSPLAHKGRAIYGRVIKGFNANKRFQTGSHILEALEMGSSYSWDLAQRDRFEDNPMSATGVRTTVIVGNTGYGGISSLANELGSDGTVYAATANLNCAAIEISFPEKGKKPKVGAIRESKGDTAYLLMDGFDHSSIAYKDAKHKDNRVLLGFVLKALAIKNTQDFKHWIKECDTHTTDILAQHAGAQDAHKHGYQNTVFRVRDDHDFDVHDYVIEFYNDASTGNNDKLAELVNKKAVVKVHAFKGNASFRSFMIDCSALYRILKTQEKTLNISLSAMPDLNDSRNLVGYRSFGNDDISQVTLDEQAAHNFFKSNRTLFVDIRLSREQKEALFWIKNLDAVE